MCNEELALLIISGENELLSELYIQNKGIIYKCAYSFYKRHTERCTKCGIELEDLFNEAFFSLPEAVQGFCKSKEYKFTSYLKYPLLKRFNEIIGYRTKTGFKEPLNNCISLDMNISESDSEETTLIDMLADEQAAFEDDVIELCARSGIFPAIKETLHNDFAYNCIDLNYKQGLSCAKIGETYGYSGTYINTVIREALKKLKKVPNTAFMRACSDIIDMSYNRSGLNCFKSTGTSSTEWAVLKLLEM